MRNSEYKRVLGFRNYSIDQKNKSKGNSNVSKRLEYMNADENQEPSLMSLELRESEFNSNLDNFLLNHQSLLDKSNQSNNH